LLVALAALAGCSDGVTGPAQRDVDASASAQWNLLARSLVIEGALAPPVASRLYANLSVAQYGAVMEFTRARIRASLAGGREEIPSVHAAIASASSAILSDFFPTRTALILSEMNVERALRRGRGDTDEAIREGELIGIDVARAVLDRAHADRSDAVWNGLRPTGPGLWSGTQPQLPMWGQVRPWVLESGSQLRSAPPPAFESETFRNAVAEVRAISDSRTPQQMEIARLWADGAGTYTPAGHWNEIAATLIEQHGLSEPNAARTLALMNIAVMDAVIACWDTKFTYWVVRPYQADPAISTPIGQPPHPSYPSGHACMSGAAAAVLGALFPDAAARLHDMAVEACDSRVYAGIHYGFDAEAGMKIGEEAARLVLAVGNGVLQDVFSR
jgi:membrane-associated phospholipid phosphatase